MGDIGKSLPNQDKDRWKSEKICVAKRERVFHAVYAWKGMWKEGKEIRAVKCERALHDLPVP